MPWLSLRMEIAIDCIVNIILVASCLLVDAAESPWEALVEIIVCCFVCLEIGQLAKHPGMKKGSLGLQIGNFLLNAFQLSHQILVHPFTALRLPYDTF